MKEAIQRESRVSRLQTQPAELLGLKLLKQLHNSAALCSFPPIKVGFPATDVKLEQQPVLQGGKILFQYLISHRGGEMDWFQCKWR